MFTYSTCFLCGTRRAVMHQCQRPLWGCCKIVCCEVNLTAVRLKSAVVSFWFCLTAASAVCLTRPSALDSITQLIEFISTNIGSGKNSIPLIKMYAHCFWGWKLKSNFWSPVLKTLHTTAQPFPLCLMTCPVHTRQNRQQRRSLSPSIELSQRC